MENLQATFKAEWAGRRNQGDGNAVCRKDESIGQERLTERAVTIKGLTDFDQIVDVINFPEDCDTGLKR
ncbi:MAG: hypothetical protein GTO40_20150, partial [Deltaproteobacteria bacterium]|nr:hypothetical protein [Deltaproteobacteria bacterium]